MADSQILSELVDIAVDTYEEGMSQDGKQNIIKKALDKAQESGLTSDEIQSIEKTLQETLNSNDKLDKQAFKTQLSQKVFENVNINIDNQVQAQENEIQDEVLQDLVDTAVSTLEQTNTKDVAQSKDAIVKATVEKATQNGIAQEDIAKIEEGVRKVLEAYDTADTNNETFSTDSFKATLSNELAPVVQNSSISFNNSIDQNNNGAQKDLTAINNEIDQFNSVMQNEPAQNDAVVFNNIENALNFNVQIQNVSQNEEIEKNTEDVIVSNDTEEILVPNSEKTIVEEVEPIVTVTPDTTAPTAATITISDVGNSTSDGITSTATVTVGGLEVGATWEYSLNGGTTWNTGSSTSFTLSEATYSIGDIQVRQTDSAGNVSEVTSNTSAYTIDTTANSTAPTLTTATLENTANTNATIQGPEAGKAYLVNTNNTPTSVSDITALADNQYNVVEITTANTDTNLPTLGLTPGTYKIYFADNAGNLTTTASTNSVTVTNDITPPSAPTISLATDTGTSDSDYITNDATVNVSGLEANATWQYSTDGGSTWSDGTSTSFELSDGTYSANDIQVKQTDEANNTSTVGKIASQVVVDTTAPTNTVSTATITPSDNVAVQSSETGTAYLVDSTETISSVSDITALADNKYNSVAISTANQDTNLAATGLSNGTYKLYTVDSAGNLSTASTDTITVTAPASVTSVSSTASDGTYKAGDSIAITVTFDDSVTVTGTPQLTLETGTTDRTIDYVSGSGTDTLTFTYVVQAGDVSSDLDFTSTSALALNSGTIKDDTNNLDATLTLPSPGATNSLGDNKAIVVDAVAPTVSSVALTATSESTNSVLNAGDTVTATVTMSESVTITGTPQLALNIGGTTVQADYASGTGTTSLTFTYTITNEIDTDGISIDANSLALNSGTIADSAGNSATLTHTAVSDNNTYKVDTTAPTLSSSTPADDATAVAIGGDLTLTFSEAVSKGTGNITLYDVTGSTALATYDVSSASEITGWGTDTLTINPASDLAANNDYAIKVDSTAIADSAGNAYAGIGDNTTLNFQTGAALDTTKVVFDLVGGTSSDHSNRTFDSSTPYTIYIQVDSDAKGLNTNANSGNGTWGTWSGISNLGSDDKIVLVGNNGEVIFSGAATKKVNKSTAFIMNNFNSGSMNNIHWKNSDGQSVALMNFYGTLKTYYSGSAASKLSSVKLWSGSANSRFTTIGNNNITKISQVYLTTMQPGVMTSQGLA